ncbi:TPA: hypothetical protein RTH43_001665, partial [Campylobacter jejuni]|nr:hypothetical protein [Campylobacter jejuni]
MIKDNKRLKDIIADEKKLKKEIENLKKNENKSTKELSLQGRLEFLQKNRQKAKNYGKNITNPQTQASNDDKKKKGKSPQDKPNNKNINSK